MTTQEHKRRDEREVVYDLKSHIGILSTSGTGWTREVNIVAWNHRSPRLDIRDWDPEHQRMSRGIGLNAEEAKNLLLLLEEMDLDELAA